MTDYRIRYDRGCYKCRSNYCPGDCEDKDYKIGTQEDHDEKFVKRRNGDGYAYSIALAGESLPDWKFRSNGSGVHTVTDAELEEYARIVAYKVANNLSRGFVMDPTMDPLRYE